MSTKTIENFSLYTFHLMKMNLKKDDHYDIFVMEGEFLISSNRDDNESKAYSFKKIFKVDNKETTTNSSDFDWKIKSIGKNPIGKDLYHKLCICLDNIVEQFGQVVPADDAFKFDFNTEVVLGRQIN